MKINLLPWREAVIDYNKKFFMRAMLIAVFASVVFLAGTKFIFFGNTAHTESYLQQLEETKTSLIEKAKDFLGYKKTNEEISNRLLTLKSLQYSRFETIRLLNEIVKITPKGVYLNKLVRKNNEVSITGTAHSNLLISDFIAAIDKSHELKNISLQKVEKKDEKDLSTTEFDMTLALTMSPTGS